MRLPRAYELVCDCDFYDFPHRFLGGRCTGENYVKKSYQEQTQYGDCVCSSYGRCEILDGIENIQNSTCLIDFIRYEGIRPPMKYRNNKLTHFKQSA